jgi:Outer membrane protein beta-barrel domain
MSQPKHIILALVLSILGLMTGSPLAAADPQGEKVTWDNLKQLQVGQKIEVIDMEFKYLEGTFLDAPKQAISLRTAKGGISVERANVLRVSDRMHSMWKEFYWAAIAMRPLASANARAQPSVGRTELGVQFTTINLNEFGEKPSGVGGRFGYNVSSHISLDTEVNHFPENPSGNFGETLALFGVKVGKRFDRLGVFAKARPGVIHFGGGDFSQRLRDKTHFAVDLGGVLEYRLSPHIFVRFDLGDTIIAFRGATFLSAVSPGPTRLGTIHSLQASIGLGIRF